MGNHLNGTVGQTETPPNPPPPLPPRHRGAGGQGGGRVRQERFSVETLRI
ncbi:hypothetical protein VL20_2608 [Microcystis panniformis FACHB-1757]|uniref:Uncharacterized protein n=1 Tax=Microcystis panniformis FACHB-1757 TaxID=1638788 RepID=A0A0K1S0L4_9CHRO|nr:hypothetical protein VL20_2608 [Microcystis panniformis FACHB-1757]